MLPKYFSQRSFFNNFYNWYLQLRIKIYNIFDIEKPSIKTPPSDYVLIYGDNFSQFNTDKWRLSQPWGDFHEYNLDWYYPTNEDSVFVNNDGLVLELKHNPKTFIKSQLPSYRQSPTLPEQWVSHWSGALMMSKFSFKYGWLEATIKLPKEKSQWPAFWTTGKNVWPPEIDILEAYSKNDPEKLHIKPNIHWGDTGDKTKRQYGAPTIDIKNPTDRFIQYAIHWTEDFIRFYYDGLLVQECTNKEMLDYMGKDEHVIILNHGFKQTKISPTGSQMIVKNIKLFQKEH
jgi:hypothetical protein